MGIFSWFMKGLGYEDKDKKGKKAKDKEEDKYQDFNLHEKVGGEGQTAGPVSSGFNMSGFGSPESNTILLAPKSKSEMQKIVDFLKQGQSVACNLEEIAEEHLDDILNFLSGALYALNGSITRLKDDLFLLTPEGHKILKPNN